MYRNNQKEPNNQFALNVFAPITLVSRKVIIMLIAASVLYMSFPQIWSYAQASVQSTQNDMSFVEGQTAATILVENGQPTLSQSGWDLDFGEDGMLDSNCASSAAVLDIADSDAQKDHYSRIRLQSTGKILLSSSCNEQWTLARYNSDGTIDATFGTDGKIVTNFNLATIQEDDKILAEFGLSIARFDADGQPDLSFGNAGVADVLASTEPNDWFTKMLLQEDGQIVAVGKSGDERILARYNADGTLDTAFNDTGFLLTNPYTPSYILQQSSCVYGSGLAQQSDGKLLVGGCYYIVVPSADMTTDYWSEWISVWHYETDGQQDSSLGPSGYDGGDLSDEGFADHSIAIQSNGRIIRAIKNGWRDELVGRQSNGTADPDFASFIPDDRTIVNFQIDNSDRILVRTGRGANRLTRLLPTGEIDTSFGRDGHVLLPHSSDLSSEGLGFVVDDSGNIIVGIDVNQNMSLFRYVDEGPLPALENQLHLPFLVR